MDINDNQQINTFLKGMNTDVSDALIESSQYRYAENLRLVTNTDSNEGELHLIDGTKIRCDLFRSLVGADPQDKIDIIYLTSIRNYVVVFIRNITDGTWFALKSETGGVLNSFVLIFGPCSDPIWDDVPAISGVCRWESDNNIKLYFSDNTGRHPILYLKLNGNSNYADTTNINELYGQSGALMDKPIVDIVNETGNLIAAKVQYAYRYYKTGGATTQLSPLSKIVPLYKDHYTGYRKDQVTGRSVRVRIVKDNVVVLPKIQIFRINYTEAGLPPTINIIYDEDVSNVPAGGSIDYVDNGSNIESYDISEFLSTIQLSIKPKVIESKGDYLYAANIKYTQDEVDERLLKNYDLSKIRVDSEFKYDLINAENEFLNEPVNIPQEQYVTLRSGETYRYGIIFYDEYGNRSTVHHIKDYTVPSQPTESIQFSKDSSGRLKFNVRRNGIRVTVPYLQNCSGYEIVRCIRDFDTSHVLFQGIIGFPVELTHQGFLDANDLPIRTSGKICPTGFFTEQNFDFQTYRIDGSVTTTYAVGAASTCTDVIQFACPEYAYQPDDVEDLLKDNNINLEYVAQYTIDVDKRENRKSGSSFPYVYFPTTYYSKRYVDANVGYSSDGYLTHPLGFFNDNGTASWHTGSSILNTYVHHGNYFPDENDSKPFVGTVRFINHIIPSSIYTNDSTHWKKLSIDGVSYAKSPNGNLFSNGTSIRFLDDISIIGTKEYINWTAPLLLNENFDEASSGRIATKRRWWFNVSDQEQQDPKRETENIIIGLMDTEDTLVLKYLYPIGAGGYCMLLNTKSIVSPTYGTIYGRDPQYGIGEYWLPITVANITKPSNGYGDKKQSTYYSFGNFVSTFVNQPDRWGPIGQSGSAERLTTVFDGDAYFQVFNYNAAHYFYDALYGHGKNTVVYSVPLETDIDLRAHYGERFIDDLNIYIQDEPGTVGKPGGSVTLSEYAYAYNTAYGQSPTTMSFAQSTKEDIDSNDCDTRIHVSLNKTNGERIDSWLQFKALDFIDVDSRFGEITQLKLFKDKLIYWLNNAIGIIGSNDRTILNDIDSNQIVLGTGAVLQRFDYISTIYGMKPDLFADAQSNTTLYWWDGYQKEICAFGESVIPLGTVKQVRNYLNVGSENNKPHLLYDPKHKELLCSVTNNEAVVYNEYVQLFTSVYKFMPLFSTSVLNNIIITNDTSLYTYNEQYQQNKSKLFSSDAEPKIQYVVNKNNIYNKVFDISTFGGRFYGGDSGLSNLQFKFKTPLKQESSGSGLDLITNREYDFRLNIPRNNNDLFGGRMRGKTMQCELKSSSNSTDFSLQYITTKYRMSWS